ncbi:hypothetical protein BDZ45DRAFT_364316 [Acephala macrosclerotiorum]|nr:hypothetical protein BDZ45DRAFT_364316 [Acephala macrosclerotiorum]
MIWAADTWLRVTASTIFYSKVKVAKSSHSTFGLGISPQCEGFCDNHTNPSKNFLSCLDASSLTGIRINSGFAILNAAPKDRRLFTVPGNDTFSEVSFVSAHLYDPNFDDGIDYIATTFRFSPSCTFATKECNMTEYDNDHSGAWVYNCSARFWGVPSTDPMHNEFTSPCLSFGKGCWGIYQNSSFLGGTTIGGNDHINPLYTGLAA